MAGYGSLVECAEGGEVVDVSAEPGLCQNT